MKRVKITSVDKVPVPGKPNTFYAWQALLRLSCGHDRVTSAGDPFPKTTICHQCGKRKA